MEFKQCQYKNKVKKIPVRHINGQYYMLLTDVHDCFPGIRRFTFNGKPIPFEHDEDNVRLQPERIRVFSEEVIDCHTLKQGDKVFPGIDDTFQEERPLTSKDAKKILDVIEKKFDAIQRQTFELMEYPMPRLFILLPEDTKCYDPHNWFHLNYRLYFLCECENVDERHLAFHEGYEIKQPREFLRKYGPYLNKMLTVVKHAMSVGSLIVPQLASTASGISNYVIPQDRMFWNNLNVRIEQLGKILTKAQESVNLSTETDFQHVEGAELREVQCFLKKTDAHRTLGNLYRSVTSDGNVRWVCIHHYEKHSSERSIKVLYEEFEKLGGEIRRDTAVMGKQASNSFSKILNVLRRGLPVFSVTLKDLKLKKNEFDTLLNFVSQYSRIDNLEIENITVSRKVGFNMENRIIISKLETAVNQNSKLHIQYSFTEPLKKFSSELINSIKLTNSRLVLRVRCQEHTPSLKLAGTNENGFTLSIVNSDGKGKTNYETAIENVRLMMYNITKFHLRDGIISESIWTCLDQFLSKNKTLQELTVECRLTLEQTRALSFNLSSNRTLKALHMFNVWEREDEINGCKEIFKMLQKNSALNEFALTCHSGRLELDTVARCLLQNKSLRVLRLPKCQIHRNTDIEPIENFLRNTSIQTLSFELMNTNCDETLEKFARAVNENRSVEILKLIGSECSAIFHRKETIPDSENPSVPSAPTPVIKRSSRSKFKRFLALFSCRDDEHRRHSHDETILTPVVSTPKNHRKYVFDESLCAFFNHPPFYKQIQEIAQNFKLEELQVTIGAHVEMRNVVKSIKSNSTVTGLNIRKRILRQDDIQMLVEAVRDNTTLTHLSLNEIDLTLIDFHKIFDVLQYSQTLRVLDVKQSVRRSDRNSFLKEIKTLALHNPYLEVVYETD